MVLKGDRPFSEKKKNRITEIRTVFRKIHRLIFIIQINKCRELHDDELHIQFE